MAGGMESMSNAPYLLDKARFGYRMGHGELLDSMILDGLWSPTDDVHMGVYGSNGARDHEITRRQQDEWALRSQQRYAAALAAGKFADEVMPIDVPLPKGGSKRVDADEQPRPDTTLEKLAALKPAFEEDGTVTAGNAPGVNDGAAAVVLMKRSTAEELGAPILATWVASGEAALEPHHMNAVPAYAMQRALEKAQLQLEGRGAGGDQRGVRRGPARRLQDSGARPREGQRRRRRGRHRPPHRRLGRAHPDAPDL